MLDIDPYNVMHNSASRTLTSSAIASTASTTGPGDHVIQDPEDALIDAC